MMSLYEKNNMMENVKNKVIKQMLTEWGIKHVLSSAYHPQLQGALERRHKPLIPNF